VCLVYCCTHTPSSLRHRASSVRFSLGFFCYRRPRTTVRNHRPAYEEPMARVHRSICRTRGRRRGVLLCLRRAQFLDRTVDSVIHAVVESVTPCACKLPPYLGGDKANAFTCKPLTTTSSAPSSDAAWCPSCCVCLRPVSAVALDLTYRVTRSAPSSCPCRLLLCHRFPSGNWRDTSFGLRRA
jgi:hypothetical protein